MDNNKNTENSKKYINVQKICPKCGSKYKDTDYRCDNCGRVFMSPEKQFGSSRFWFSFSLLFPFISIFFISKVKNQSERLYESYKKGLIYGGIIYFCLVVALSIYFSQGGPSLFA